MTPAEKAEALREKFGDLVSEPREFRGEIMVVVAEAQRIAEICAHAKTELGFNYLVDLSSVDNYGEDPRFELVYELYGYDHGCHLRLKTSLSEEVGEVPSVAGVWRTADWHEREVFDMMGIRFVGHPDLRRILMWEGYPHFPLRKDFPLAGKATEMPDVAFSNPAPLEGGPFVTSPGACGSEEREPRAKTFEP